VAKLPFVFARITDKAISAYREFFTRFGVRVPVIADLDLLVNGFDHIDPNDDVKTAQRHLLAKVDELICPMPTPIREGRQGCSTILVNFVPWRKVRSRRPNLRLEHAPKPSMMRRRGVFCVAAQGDRLAVLKTSADKQMLQLKHASGAAEKC
jgi:hypothetical protein